jgi:5-hydroxyisourate hydrolase-like protein (transthyretin family)
VVVVYIQYSTKLGTNSQSKLGKFTYPFAAGQYIEIKTFKVHTRNSFKVSTITLSLLDESIHVPSIHCPVLYVTHCSVSIVRLHVNILNFMA